MTKPFLVEPSIHHQKSFEAYVKSYRASKDTHYFDKYKEALEDFQGYLSTLQSASLKKDITSDEVSSSTFWMIDHETVVAVVRIRHQEDPIGGHIGYDVSPDFRHRGYGTQLLKLALKKASEMGLREVVLTCDVDNLPSRKIIERCNGRYEGTIVDETESETLLKFVIELTG